MPSSIKKTAWDGAGPPVAPARHSLKKGPSVDSSGRTQSVDDPARQSMKKGTSVDSSGRTQSIDDPARQSMKKGTSVDSSGRTQSIDDPARQSMKKTHSIDDSARGSIRKQQIEDAAAMARLDRMKKVAEERYRFEQRVLTICTGSLVLIAVLWTVALSTDHWFELDPPPGGVFLRDTRTVIRSGHTGLWWLCSEQFHPTNLSDYESVTTTPAPVTTTRRPRAQPCKWMGLRGRKRKRCRQLITNRFRFGLAARRKQAPPRPNAPQSAGAGAAPGAPGPPAAARGGAGQPPGSPLDYFDDTNATDTDWLTEDFDQQVSHVEDQITSPDTAGDEEIVLEPLDPEKESILLAVEDEILERIKDGEEDDKTVNETLADVLEEVIDEVTSVTFRECRVRELTVQLQQTAAEWQMLSYMRTLLTFSVVSVLLLVLGFLSALYTFKEPRYTFKRLAAGIQFIAFCGLLVVIQVFRNAALYEQWSQLNGVPLAMGYSQVLAWLCLSVQLLSSFFFLLYSRKKKRYKAPNEEVAMADEPTIIGR